MSRCTGPGRPPRASRKARRASSGMRRPSFTTAFHLVSGAVTARVSMSMNTPTWGYDAARCWLVVMASSGRWLLKATPRPEAMLRPPGPSSPTATAIRPVPACTAAAIIGPAASWRTPMKRMPGSRLSAWNSGESLPPTMPNTVSTPSARSTRTRACAPVRCSTAGLAGARPVRVSVGGLRVIGVRVGFRAADDARQDRLTRWTIRSNPCIFPASLCQALT